MENIYILLITSIAGLSTLLGYIIIYFKINKKRIINITFSISSGILFSISLFDLMFEAIKLFNNKYSIILYLILFSIGFILCFFISKKINIKDELYKTGLISMIGIIIHNIPEGILTYASFNINVRLGLKMAFMILLHNIPEGISISIPIYYSTKNKFTTFKYVLISGIAEPLGALISILFLKNFINNTFLGILLSLVSGIMIYISIFELLKEAYKYNKNTTNILFLLGFLFMLIIIILN